MIPSTSAAQTVPGGYSISTYKSGLSTTPYTIAMDPASRDIFFVGSGQSVYRIPAGAGAEQNLGAYGIINAYIAGDLSFSDGQLYLSCFSTQKIAASGGSPVTVATLPSGFGYESGGAVVNGALYVTAGASTSGNVLARVDLATSEVTTLGGVPMNLSSLEYNARDGYLYGVQLVGYGSATFYRINPANGAATALPAPGTGTFNYSTNPTGSGDGDLTLDPTGQYIFFRKTTAIYRYEIASGATTAFATGLSNAVYADDLTFGPSSDGTGLMSLYAVEGSGIVEIAGFGGAPTITAGSATGVTISAATLSGTVNPNALATTAQFEYGVTTSYSGTGSVTVAPNNGTSEQAVSVALSGLNPHTLYHYRLVASNAAGDPATADGTFTTANSLPLAANDTFETPEPGAFEADVLANDGGDPDGDTVTVESVSNAIGGTAAPSSAGTRVLFTPGVGFDGNGSFDYTVTDGFGGTATAHVTLTDTTAPVVVLPAGLSGGTGTGEAGDGGGGNMTAEAQSAAGAVVDFDVTAGDNVLVVSVVNAPASGSTFPLGTTIVTSTATDAAGNVGMSSFTVTVSDTTAPVVSTAGNIVAEATSAAGATVIFSPTAGDAVGVTSLTTNYASGSTFPIGARAVTVTAGDAAGNSGGASFTVTVQDTTAPSFTAVPGTQTVRSNVAGLAPVPNLASQAAATDAVRVTSFTQSPSAGSTVGLGTHTITITARDAAGHISTAAVLLNVLQGNRPPAAAADSEFAARASVLIDVLANDSDIEGDAFTLASVSQPVSGGVARIEAGKVRFTPSATVSAPITFTYTVSDGMDSGTGTVTIKPVSNLSGNYVGLLSDGSTALGRVRLAVSVSGAVSGNVQRDGGTLSFKGSVIGGGLISVFTGAKTPRIPLTVTVGENDASGRSMLVVSVPAPVTGTLTGLLERSPYDASHPAPQAGRYTIVANLLDGGVGPATGAVLTCNITTSGAATFSGRRAHGGSISSGGQLLAGGRHPFFQAIGAVAVTERLVGELVFDRAASPAVSGTLSWHLPVGLNPRLAAGVEQDYAMLGMPYTPGANAAAMYSPAATAATLTLELPSVPESPLSLSLNLAGTYSRGFQRVLSTVGPTHIDMFPSTGFFYGEYKPARAVKRPFFGVVLQGAGYNYGQGNALDATTIQNMALTVVP
ncbi:MAG: HYR domain-containing protein [Chthoniobacteraceae bacterium]